MKTGAITLPIALVGSLLLSVVSGLSAYYGTANAQSEKINEARLELKADISADRQEIATLKEAINTIKQNQLEQRSDIKEILRILK